MELKLYFESLSESGKKYQSRFNLKTSDFLPEVQSAILAVRLAGGRSVFYESAGSYSAIVQ